MMGKFSGNKGARDNKHPQNPTRRQSDSVKEYFYDIPKSLSQNVNIRKVMKWSDAALDMHRSSVRGKMTVAIRGTRSQIQEALRLITKMTGEHRRILAKAQRYWLQWVQEAFPDLETRTYFVPSAYFRRVPRIETHFAGENVLVLRTQTIQNNSDEQPATSSSVTAQLPCSSSFSVQESDILDDEAFQRVLFTLRKFSKIDNEVFMCLSQFPFGSYLGEERFAPAAAHLPLPSNLPQKWHRSWRQGDFDVLLIHPSYGVVICEVKAVGFSTEESQDVQCERVIKKLSEAIGQLDKAEAMLTHLMSDAGNSLNVTKTIACPNLSTHQLQKVVLESQQLEKQMRRCLKIINPTEIFHLVLCSDHVCEPGAPQVVIDAKMEVLRTWWAKCVVRRRARRQPNYDIYKKLVARFCGPASTVSVPSISTPRVSMKTLAQAVSHVGYCYTSHITLFPEQMELLMRAPSRVFIDGPPGTGKSVVLLLMAEKWLRQNNIVYVLSTWDRSYAASYRLYHLLQHTLPEQKAKQGQVQLLQKNFVLKEDVDTALVEFSQAFKDRPLCIIVDEPGPDHESQYYVFPDFCTKLLDRFENHVHMWAASCKHNLAPDEPQDEKLEGWELHSFTRPLRTPPSVTREIQKAVEIDKECTVRRYTERGVPDYADGLDVRWVYHPSQRHGSSRAEDCAVCAKDVVKILEKLRLATKSTPVNIGHIKLPENLQYRDVLILSWVKLTEDAPILKTLRNAKIPVRVMSDEDIEDVATAHSDVVWAARQQLVCGLERKVVVIIDNYDDSQGEYVFTRLRAMSRCSSQLVVVCPPPGRKED